MGDEYIHYFGIKVDKIDCGYSLGMCLSVETFSKECYLYINLVKWSISIGLLSKCKEDDEH